MNLVEGDPKSLFSIATTLGFRGGRYNIPWIAPLYPWSLPYSAEFQARRYQVPFLSLWYNSTWDWTPVSRIIGEWSVTFFNPGKITTTQHMYFFSPTAILHYSSDWSTILTRPGDLCSIPGPVIPKTLKMVLDTSLLNTQQYKVRIKGKVKQSRERSSVLPYTLG